MLSFTDLAPLPVVVAVVIAMFLGTVWYGPLFGKPWLALTKLTEKQIQDAMKKSIAIGSLNTAIYVIAVALMTNAFEQASYLNTLLPAFLLWLGLSATTEAAGSIWDKRPWKLFLIHIGYTFCVLLITSALVFFWS